jgi:hypothetical protein
MQVSPLLETPMLMQLANSTRKEHITYGNQYHDMYID